MVVFLLLISVKLALLLFVMLVMADFSFVNTLLEMATFAQHNFQIVDVAKLPLEVLVLFVNSHYSTLI